MDRVKTVSGHDTENHGELPALVGVMTHEVERQVTDRITYDGTNAVEVLEFLNGFQLEQNSDFNGKPIEWSRGGLTHTIPIGSVVKGRWDIRIPEKSDRVNHPYHYGGDTTYEAIKVIEAWGADFCIGNTLKYLSRAGKKNDELEDLKKAQWYLERKIKQLEQRNRYLPQ